MSEMIIGEKNLFTRTLSYVKDGYLAYLSSSNAISLLLFPPPPFLNHDARPVMNFLP